MTPTLQLSPPSFPARPINGGALEHAGPKIGTWRDEPKYNGWRALTHIPTGSMWNRQGQRLTIEREFAKSLACLKSLPFPSDWLDCEPLSRRHGIGRGALIILDYLPVDGMPNLIYDERRKDLESCYPLHDITQKPAADSVLLCPSFGSDLSDALWHDLQELSREWLGLNEPSAARQPVKLALDPNRQFYEGIVMKRADSPYPMQLRSADTETPHWMKHRWMFGH